MGRFQARRIWSLINVFPPTPIRIRPRGHDKAILRKEAQPRFSRWLLAALLATIATSSDAKVLRSNNNAPTVWVFRDADALRRFDKVVRAGVNDDAAVLKLVACKTAQGSRVDVLGSGYRTAFVRVAEGSASGCQGTVPKENVRDQ